MICTFYMIIINVTIDRFTKFFEIIVAPSLYYTRVPFVKYSIFQDQIFSQRFDRFFWFVSCSKSHYQSRPRSKSSSESWSNFTSRSNSGTKTGYRSKFYFKRVRSSLVSFSSLIPSDETFQVYNQTAIYVWLISEPPTFASTIDSSDIEILFQVFLPILFQALVHNLVHNPQPVTALS